MARPLEEQDDWMSKSKEEKKKFMDKAKETMETAKMKLKEIDLGTNPSLNENMSLKEFCEAIDPTFGFGPFCCDYIHCQLCKQG